MCMYECVYVALCINECMYVCASPFSSRCKTRPGSNYTKVKVILTVLLNILVTKYKVKFEYLNFLNTYFFVNTTGNNVCTGTYMY